MPIFKDPELMQEITDGIHDVVFTPATPDLVGHIVTLEFLCNRIKDALITGRDRHKMLADLSLVQSFSFIDTNQMEELTSLTLE